MFNTSWRMPIQVLTTHHTFPALPPHPGYLGHTAVLELLTELPFISVCGHAHVCAYMSECVCTCARTRVCVCVCDSSLLVLSPVIWASAPDDARPDFFPPQHEGNWCHSAHAVSLCSAHHPWPLHLIFISLVPGPPKERGSVMLTATSHSPEQILGCLLSSCNPFPQINSVDPGRIPC